MKRTLLIALLSMIATLALAVSIDHFSPGVYAFGADTELRINVIDGFDTIREVKLVWRRTNETAWRKEKMNLESTGAYWFVVDLTARDLGDFDIEYYFEIALLDGNIENIPALDGLSPKYTLSPGNMAGELSEAFILLSDEPNPSQGAEYILAVSFYDLATTIDPASIKVWVGGRDVTKRAVITDNSLIYRDPSPTPGNRRAMVSAIVDGRQVHSRLWSTDVPVNPDRPFLPLNIRGNLSFISNVYDLNTASASSNLVESVDDATGKLDLYSTYGKLNMQANFLVSTLEDSNQQAVNRYTIGLQLPVLDVFLGDSTPTLSELSMANRNVRGLAAKFHTKFLSLSWVHGEMLRATTSSYDDGFGNIRNTGTFRQEAIGARFQMGNDQSFMLGINAIRNRDLISSLDPADYSYTDANNDTVFTTTPRDNAVVSLDLRLAVPEQHFVIGGEIAGSMLNRNTLPGAMSQQEIEDYLEDDLPINIDPQDYAELFVINKNIEPIMPGRENLAWQAYLRTIILKNMIDIRYSETGPAYNALSTYYQQNDTKMLSITDQINFNNIVILAGGFNMMQDNLSGHKNESTKSNSWNAQATLRIPRFPYLKASYFNNASLNELNPDINDPAYVFNPFERKSGQFSFGMGYNFIQIPVVPTNLDLTYRFGGDDSTTNDIMEYQNSNNSINFSITNRFVPVPLKTQIVLSLNQSNRDETGSPLLYPLFENQNMNLLLGADYSLLKNMLRPFARYKLLNLGGDQDKQSYSTFSLGLEAFPIRDLSIGTEIGFQNYKNDADSSLDYDNLTWRFVLNQRF